VRQGSKEALRQGDARRRSPEASEEEKTYFLYIRKRKKDGESYIQTGRKKRQSTQMLNHEKIEGWEGK